MVFISFDHSQSTDWCEVIPRHWLQVLRTNWKDHYSNCAYSFIIWVLLCVHIFHLWKHLLYDCSHLRWKRTITWNRWNKNNNWNLSNSLWIVIVLYQEDFNFFKSSLIWKLNDVIGLYCLCSCWIHSLRVKR